MVRLWFWTLPYVYHPEHTVDEEEDWDENWNAEVEDIAASLFFFFPPVAAGAGVVGVRLENNVVAGTVLSRYDAVANVGTHHPSLLRFSMVYPGEIANAEAADDKRGHPRRSAPARRRPHRTRVELRARSSSCSSCCSCSCRCTMILAVPT